MGTKTFESIPMYHDTAQELRHRLVKLDYQCHMFHYARDFWKLRITVPAYKAKAVENAVSRFVEIVPFLPLLKREDTF